MIFGVWPFMVWAVAFYLLYGFLRPFLSRQIKEGIEEELEEEPVEYEKTEDLVQAYFHSMGDISILTKDEETELAKRLEEGKNIIRDIVVAMPLYKNVEEQLALEREQLGEEEEIEDQEVEEGEEEEKPDEADPKKGEGKTPEAKEKKPKPVEISGVENLIRTMLKKHKTPFMLIRKSVLAKQFARFKKSFPEVTPYYAIKANPHPKIVKTFAELGASFDVASAAEIRSSSIMVPASVHRNSIASALRCGRPATILCDGPRNGAAFSAVAGIPGCAIPGSGAVVPRPSLRRAFCLSRPRR